MAAARVPAWRTLYVLTGVVVLGLAGLARAAADDDALRRKALALNDVTGSDPIEGEVKALVGDPKGTKKLITTAVPMAKEKNQPFNYNAAYILARTAQELKDFESCEVFYRVCAELAVKLQSGQKIVQAFGGLIDLYYDQKEYAKAVRICREFLDIKGNDTIDRLKPAVLERLVQSLARQGKTDEALKLVENLVKAEAEDNGWWFLQLKGWVLREADQLDEAAKVYESVLEKIAKDKDLKKDQRERFAERTRYLLSSVYVDLNQIDKASEHLQGLLKAKPNDPTYNNDLGYIWADHDRNLEEAEKLIRKALEEDRKQRKADPDFKPEDDKDNAAYLDSLGWVLFKQKKYDEAKKALLQAVQDKEGQHIEIYDHLADVHMALKEKAEAVAVWKKGLESAGPSKREQQRKAEVEKKLKAAE